MDAGAAPTRDRRTSGRSGRLRQLVVAIAVAACPLTAASADPSGPRGHLIRTDAAARAPSRGFLSKLWPAGKAKETATTYPRPSRASAPPSEPSWNPLRRLTARSKSDPKAGRPQQQPAGNGQAANPSEAAASPVPRRYRPANPFAAGEIRQVGLEDAQADRTAVVPPPMPAPEEAAPPDAPEADAPDFTPVPRRQLTEDASPRDAGRAVEAVVDFLHVRPAPEGTDAPGRAWVRLEPQDQGEAADDGVDIVARGDRLSLVTRDAPLARVLHVLADGQGVNLVIGEGVDAAVTVSLTDVTLEEALDVILSTSGFRWHRRGNVIIVTQIGDTRATAEAQGREFRVFPLNFASAVEVEKVVRTLLSMSGQATITETDPKDNRRTREAIVVEDYPENIYRVEAYLAQADVPPLQVEIEAYVLQVVLSATDRCGVNLREVTSVGGADLSLQTQGFVSPVGAATPAVLFNFDGDNTDSLIEAIKATTDAKTLASPRVMVVNGQESRIQIGAQLGYLTTTTTQTSTMQQVDFLDVGVVLAVTPRISEDGRILMHVRPEVSSGRINPETQLPEEETTEVETAVLLPNGRGMVIGGLIKETDIESQGKVPLLGDIWVVGRLFQKRNIELERSEIIIVIVPRIVPTDGCPTPREYMDVERATTPLVYGPLKEVPRPWEAELPDAMKNPRRFRPGRLHDAVENPWKNPPRSPDHFYPTTDEERDD